MNFLFPQFLWALFALSIPVIIHLFNFRKAKKVYFSNVDMLRHVKQTSSSRLKLRHWLVLFSRLLAIFFLVMAFAQPFLSADNGNETSGNVVIYLDNSQSMSNLTEAEAPGIDLSAALAQEIISAYPRETTFQLLTNDFAPFSNYAKSKVDIEELLTELDYSSIVRTPAEIADRIGASGKATDIYWISDFAYDPEAPLETADTVNSYKLLPIVFPNTANIFIDSAYLESPFLTEGQSNTLYVSLRNNSDQTKEDMPVKLFVNDIQVAAITSDLVPNGQTTLSFELNMALEQFNRCYVSIDDFPVLFDNDFYLTLNKSARVSVVEVRGQNASPSITRVFSNSGLFHLETFDLGNINYGSFEGAELLVLNEVEQLNSGLLALVTGFLSVGRTVLLVPAQGVFDPDWGQVFGPLRQQESTALEELAPPDLTNPFYANVFEATDERMEMPSARRTMMWGNTGDHLLRFRSGSPYLSSVEVSSGTLYLLASSLSAGESSFANNALFVPVMYKLAIGARSSQSQLYYSLNEAIINTKAVQTAGSELYKLKRADQEIVPGQQALGAQVRLDIPRFMMGAGFYDVTLGDAAVDVVAFNLDKEESLLKPMDDAQILEAFNPVLKKEILKVFSAEDLEKNLKERFSGKELWKYALILTLIFLLVEVLLLRFL